MENLDMTKMILIFFVYILFNSLAAHVLLNCDHAISQQTERLIISQPKFTLQSRKFANFANYSTR